MEEVKDKVSYSAMVLCGVVVVVVLMLYMNCIYLSGFTPVINIVVFIQVHQD